MKSTSILIVSALIATHGYAQKLDWCNYWQQLGLDQTRPECKKTFLDSQCSGLPNEEFGCTNCQANCDNLNPICTMQCDPGCSCKTGFVRNTQNLCVLPTLCPMKNPAMRVGCPTVASIGLSCVVSRTNECTTSNDCAIQPGFPQPTCCITDCGNSICFRQSYG